MKAYACFSDDGRFVLDCQREAAYNRSSAIREDGTTIRCSVVQAQDVISELPDDTRVPLDHVAWSPYVGDQNRMWTRIGA